MRTERSFIENDGTRPGRKCCIHDSHRKNQNDTKELIKDEQNIFPQESRQIFFICNPSVTILKRIMIVSEWNENHIELMKGHDVRFIFFTEKITPIYVFRKKNNPILPQRSLSRPACKKTQLSCHFWTCMRNRSVHTKEKTAGKQALLFWDCSISVCLL